jgi:hypothetical protein
MSHWFDRLATWSAEENDDGEERVFTRRQAVLATAGVGAAGMLGSPLLSRAFGESGCDCARRAYNQFDNAANKLEKKYINHGNPFFLPLSAPIFVIAYAGLLTGTYVGQQYHCGVSGADCQTPSGKPPPKNAQPCTHRGGVRLHADQCGGDDGGGATGGSGCSPGTSSCPTPTGGDLCCFGSDLCCSGCCCVESCGCCG